MATQKVGIIYGMQYDDVTDPWILNRDWAVRYFILIQHCLRTLDYWKEVAERMSVSGSSGLAASMSLGVTHNLA